MKEMGDFDRIGTPYNYMVAGWSVKCDVHSSSSYLIHPPPNSPSLVATLWDVTDKDTDAFADAVFKKLRLDERAVRGWSPLQTASNDRRTAARIALASPRKRTFTVATDGPDSTPVGRLIRGGSTEDARLPVSVVSALATSRDVCKLPYLTGAAAVVYGIPFYL